MAKARFCPDEEPAPFAIFTIDEQDFTTCPVREVRSESLDALRMYNFYSAGFLPTAGGILDQPNILMEQIEVVRAVEAEAVEDKKRRNAARKR